MSWLRKLSNTFLVLFSADLIEAQERTTVGFLLEYRGILQRQNSTQSEMWNLVRQYGRFNGLSNEEAALQVMQKAGLSQAEISEAIRALSAAGLWQASTD